MWKLKKEIIQVGDLVKLDVNKTGSATYYFGVNKVLERNKLLPISVDRMANTLGEVIGTCYDHSEVTIEWDVKMMKVRQTVKKSMLILEKKGGGSACGH
ncbi:MAG: hypothetical protein MJZ20_06910 [Bacteroidaceae bacterium]|nr:hypothetical protein [Bacteroidaceae bacterium]